MGIIANIKLKSQLRRLQELRVQRHAGEFLRQIDQLLNTAVSARAWNTGRKAVELGVEAWNDGIFAPDELFILIRHQSEFLSLAGDHPGVIDLYLVAASRFSDFNAFQSAYRLLNRAEEYALEHKLYLLVLTVRETIASIALYEDDLPFAENAFSKLKEIRRQLGLTFSTELLVNYGSLQMRKGNFGAASQIFADAEVGCTDPKILLGALMNRSACLRELGDFTAAKECASKARSLITPETDDSFVVELELIECKTLVRTHEDNAALECLNAAVRRLDLMMSGTGRLHYRRGIREQYRQRIAALLGQIQATTLVSLLPAIAFLKQNSISDWLALLDWHESVNQNEGIPAELRSNLLNAITEVANLGAPVLMGYREKYDDPWSDGWEVNKEQRSERFGYSEPWSKLNGAISAICALDSDEPGPWDRATIWTRSSEISHRLSQGDCFVIIVTVSEAAHIFILHGNTFERADYPMNQVKELFESQAGFQLGSEERSAFMRILRNCVEELSGILAPALDKLATGNAKRILLMPEPLPVPVFPAIVANSRLRAQALQGNLEVCVCPVLHPLAAVGSKLDSLTACWAPQDGLGLNEEEINLVCELMSDRAPEKKELGSPIEVEQLFQSSVVHIATHGTPVSNFADAIFAHSYPSLSGFGIDSLQTCVWRTPHELVFLNSCHSADFTNWNAVTTFATNEQFGTATILLLNRRSSVISSSWTTFDVSAFVFSYFFYSNLTSGMQPGAAFMKAVAELYDVNTDGIRNILKRISNETTRNEKLQKFEVDGAPFQHPYVSGTYQFMTLL